jgi:hypothetical protein
MSAVRRWNDTSFVCVDRLWYMDLRYPVGKFEWSAKVDPGMRPHWIADIAEAGARFREAVRGLDQEQLDTPYRPGGWTVRVAPENGLEINL